MAEVTVIGVPAVLVPLPGAPGDHQTANAAALAAAGGAVVLPDRQCTGARLAEEIEALRSPPQRLEHMREAAASLGRTDAVAAVVSLVETHARGGARPAGGRRQRPGVPGRSVSDAAGGEAVDLSYPRRIHLVGVGGAGMSAIASVLAAMGHRVTGSDLKASPTTERLAASGVVVWIGHDAAHVGDAELVTISTAIAATNPEVVEARRRGVRVLSRAEATAAVAASRRCVAVSGTHGKTTTTSMLALILVEAGLRPSFLIGGDVNEIGTNAVWDTGAWLVIEADESDGTFLALDPEVAVVTNVEPDHLDFYGGFPTLVAAFDRFCTGRSGAVVVGADDAVAAELGRAHGADLVGTAPDATFRIESPRAGARRRVVRPEHRRASPRDDLAFP